MLHEQAQQQQLDEKTQLVDNETQLETQLVENENQMAEPCLDDGASTSGTKREFGPVEVRELDVKQQLEKELSTYGRKKEDFKFEWSRLVSLGLVAAEITRLQLPERALDVADYEKGLVSEAGYEKTMNEYVNLVKNKRLEIERLIFDAKIHIKQDEKKLKQDKKKLKQNKKKK